MKVSVRFFVLLFCCFSFAGIAQQGSPLTQSTPTLGGSAGAPGADRRITLDVVVTDRSGKPVPGLQQADFTLLDNKQPQPIVDFRAADGSNRAADPPLQSIVIFDSLNAPFEYVSYQGEQLKGYLQRGGGELPLRTSLVFLTDTSTGQSAVTQDGNTLVEAMNAKGVGLRSIRRSAGFYGAVERANISSSALDKLVAYESTQPGRKLVVWLGPGWPFLTGPNVQLTGQAQDALFHAIVSQSTGMRKARVTLYSVDSPSRNDPLDREFYFERFVKGVPSANKVQNGNFAVQVLAVQSGGRVLNTNSAIADSISSCLEDGKVYYTLSFDSPAAKHPNEYHSLQIKMGKPGLAARTRTGYYAQP